MRCNAEVVLINRWICFGAPFRSSRFWNARISRERMRSMSLPIYVFALSPRGGGPVFALGQLLSPTSEFLGDEHDP